jgi:hypothetical protein
MGGVPAALQGSRSGAAVALRSKRSFDARRPALPKLLDLGKIFRKGGQAVDLERNTGFEPATFALARRRSTS